ncbi:MAG TPA: hypothetical protein VK498_08250 [Ferruginibacter sp.]|nr:hypothetical protein [Ferruginibacter sp.]
MKTNVPNQFINPQNNVLLFRNPLNLMMKRLLLLIVFALYGGTITAQELRGEAHPILEVNTYLTNLKRAEANQRTTYSVAQNVEDLLTKVQPSVYYYSGVAKTYGEKPRALFTDKQSLAGLASSTMLKNNIDIVTIKINGSDLNSFIDMSVFYSFKNLKYIYIISSTNVTAENITNMIRNNDDQKYTVFYKIDKGDNNQ